MIHRVAFGSIERFIGILIEHFAGAFPTWLAPVQVEVIPISDKHLDYANKVLDTLKAAGIRADIDTRAEKMGYKIREAQLQKIPYMLVVGGKEEENEAVSVRSRFKGDEGQMKLDDFLAAIKEEIANRETVRLKKKINCQMKGGTTFVECLLPLYHIRSNNSSGFIAGTLLSIKSLILRVTIKSTFIRCAHTI